MKKALLIIVLIIFPSYIFSQEGVLEIMSKQFESFTLDYSLDEYQSNEDLEFVKVYFKFTEEHISVTLDGETQKIICSWSEEASDDITDVFKTENNEMIVLDYEEEIIIWYRDYNDNFVRFDSMAIFSELEPVD
tara:strand:- start:24 stop:425 length:402 start_codon:yes stop_codon:yes gene_type:complete